MGGRGWCGGEGWCGRRRGQPACFHGAPRSPRPLLPHLASHLEYSVAVCVCRAFAMQFPWLCHAIGHAVAKRLPCSCNAVARAGIARNGTYPAQALRSAGYHASSCAAVGIRLEHSRTDSVRSAAHSVAMPAMEVLAAGSATMLCRPCVDCGLYTGRFCDHCLAKDRIPSEEWAPGQLTPLCS